MHLSISLLIAPTALQDVFVLLTRTLFVPFLRAHLLIDRFKRFSAQELAVAAVRAVADADTLAQLPASALWGVANTRPEKARINPET